MTNGLIVSGLTQQISFSTSTVPTEFPVTFPPDTAIPSHQSVSNACSPPMRSQLSRQLRSNSNPLSSVPPAPNSSEYSTSLANTAARILYRSPLPSQKDLPIYILNSWAFPDASTTNYDTLLPYVLARLPDDDELIGGLGYEIVFFAGGGGGDEATQTKKSRPGWGWFLQAYHVLTRATRKRLQKLYIVHEKKWIKVLVETFASIVSPKFRKKIIHGKLSHLSGCEREQADNMGLH